MDYEIYVGSYRDNIQPTIAKARWYAFGVVYKNHKAKVTIFTSNGKYVGRVYWIPTVRDGQALGPAYVNAEGKKYLIDFDGTIFDYKTGRIASFQRGKNRRA